MTAICIDDEPLVLSLVVSLCRELPPLEEVTGFSVAQETLDWLDDHTADLAILDIDMPDMNGIELALRMKEKRPNLAILFLTGYPQYAVDAFALHASGYILKPINRERLAAEVAYALSHREELKPAAHIQARTFGEFDLLVDGTSILFSRSKAKELLAYLIDRRGGRVSRANIFSALFEDAPYDRARQKQLDVIIRSLRKTLSDYGIGEILEMGSGGLRICPDKLDCDLFRLLEGDPKAINAYGGEYLTSYSWANLREAHLTFTFFHN